MNGKRKKQAHARDEVIAGRRFFISYRREGADGRLANRIRDGLAAMGAEVFVDADMPVGTAWLEEITARIASCALFIVLLSKESASSEMVQMEVRLAHDAWRRSGAARMLPVRVGYDGPLDYELAHYLDGVRHLMWKVDADDDRVVEGLVDAALQPAPPPSRRSAAPAAPPRRLDVTSRPAPGFDPRILLVTPGGAVKLRDPLYVERTAERAVMAAAALPGQTVIIKAPRQHGKSSLLARYAARCAEAGKRVARIDFQLLAEADLETAEQLFTAFAAAILRALGSDAPEPAIAGSFPMTKFLEKAVLNDSAAPLTLLLDEVDRVFGRPYQTEFFGMLRAWHNARVDVGVWENVDLALAMTTEPPFTNRDLMESPFSVGTVVKLGGFTREECRELNERYPTPLADAEVHQLFELLGGHPYLTRVAYHSVLVDGMSVPDLIRTAHEHDGPFGDHLCTLQAMISTDRRLLSALEKVIATQELGDDEIALGRRLARDGLVRIDGRRGVPANLLYARFFETAQ